MRASVFGFFSLDWESPEDWVLQARRRRLASPAVNQTEEKEGIESGVEGALINPVCVVCCHALEVALTGSGNSFGSSCK